MVTFDAKCMRCEKLVKVEFEKRFGKLHNAQELQAADKFIYDNPRFVAFCPHCKKKTIQLPVTQLEGNLSLIQPVGLVKDIKKLQS